MEHFPEEFFKLLVFVFNLRMIQETRMTKNDEFCMHSFIYALTLQKVVQVCRICVNATGAVQFID